MNILAYVVAVGGVGLDELNALLERMLGPDPRVAAIMDTFEVMTRRMRQQCQADGRTQGRAEGRRDGKAEGKADVLLALLVARFGSVPPQVEARVRAAAEAELTTWATRVLTATSLDDVFAGS